MSLEIKSGQLIGKILGETLLKYMALIIRQEFITRRDLMFKKMDTFFKLIVRVPVIVFHKLMAIHIIWTDLGSIEALTWRKDRIPKDDTPIYWKGKLYLKNEDFVENIEPGTGKGYNLYNELAFDPYTIYERYFWRDEWQRPVVVYQNKVYTLIAETNKKAGNYI